jgi:hypothetical protein
LPLYSTAVGDMMRLSRNEGEGIYEWVVEGESRHLRVFTSYERFSASMKRDVTCHLLWSTELGAMYLYEL